MKKASLSVWLLCLSLQGFAQEPPAFTWQAKLPVPDSTGFYHIALTPAVSRMAYRDGRWDIRIYTQKQEVPYVLYSDFSGSQPPSVFQPLPVINQSPGMLVFANKSRRTLDCFDIVYKNSRVRKTIQVNGSDDGQQWYGVTEQFLFDPSAGDAGTGVTSIQRIQIPRSNYAFYRLRISDTVHAPLLIEQIGIPEFPTRPPAYTAIPGVRMTPVKAARPKESAYLIDLQGIYPADRLTLKISSPALYHRRALLQQNSTRTTVTSFTLSSETPATIELPRTGYDSLYLVVLNEDSPPLTISGVEVMQKNHYLVARLEKGKTYVLCGGAPAAVPPQYDLQFFKERLNDFVVEVMTPAAPTLLAQTAPPTPAAGFFNSRWWIWAGILLIIAVLGLLVPRLVRDIKDQNTP